MLLLPLLAFLPLAILSGQTAEFSIHGGVSRLSNSNIGDLGPENYSLQDGWRIGFRTTLNTYRFFGHEFGYAYNRTQLRNETRRAEFGMAIHQGFYNFLAYATRDGATVRPFATGGVHFNNYTPPGTSVTSGGGSTKLGFNYGGGLKVRITPILAIRFDGRYYQNGKPFDFLQNRRGLIRQLEVSIGFGFVI
ncbi:MAG: outer membrane beta-barrel protein [Bryobacteraceae bacterium]|nr:outer membrane beta-barrel protein [Bryobacteraceae bacterium]MDW8378990.1 outer membrane beta-barrel protein [Bryobacterales bacterium]